MEVITWLNSNSGAITAIATAVLVVITGFYAWVTKKILEENQQMRLAFQKPIIAIYLHSAITRTGYTSVCLFVENIGVGPAYDVNFTTDFSFSIGSNRTLADVRFLERGIRYLPPRKKRVHRLGNWSDAGFPEVMKKQLEITVTYKDSLAEKYEEHFCLDFREH